MPSYYIYRETPSIEGFDPSAPLHFFPPKDSDELFFALRAAFPTVATHSERMRNAVIDFFLNESLQSSPMLPLEQSMTISTSASPHTSLDSAPSSNSPSSSSNATSPAPTTSPMVGSSSSAPCSSSKQNLESMTGVFSLSATEQPKVRQRRKMTEAERADYRKRRLTGACDLCVARKRKCKHSIESWAVQAASTQNRVVKPASKKSSGKQPALDSSSAASSFMNTVTSQAPRPASSGDLLTFDDAVVFPWQTEPDWTLLDFDASEPSHNTTFDDLVGLEMVENTIIPAADIHDSIQNHNFRPQPRETLMHNVNNVHNESANARGSALLDGVDLFHGGLAPLSGADLLHDSQSRPAPQSTTSRAPNADNFKQLPSRNDMLPLPTASDCSHSSLGHASEDTSFDGISATNDVMLARRDNDKTANKLRLDPSSSEVRVTNEARVGLSSSGLQIREKDAWKDTSEARRGRSLSESRVQNDISRQGDRFDTRQLAIVTNAPGDLPSDNNDDARKATTKETAESHLVSASSVIAPRAFDASSTLLRTSGLLVCQLHTLFMTSVLFKRCSKAVNPLTMSDGDLLGLVRDFQLVAI